MGDAERVGRRDFRDLPIVTIDGETARDFDDAVYVKRLENGHWQLQVHIADVSHYVRRGSALDREARLRGTSVYFPNRAVPMLPEELSNGICSLNPREDRLVMSAVMELDESGEIVASEFARGVIRSAERMTYTAVNAVLQHDAAATAQYAHLAEEFRAMRDLAVILTARRARLGSIDFDLPEPVIEFDAAGQMTSIVRSERNIAHRLIEEFMLTANQAVARYLERRGIGSLHRVHEKPDPKKILEFEEVAHTFGYSLGVENLAERRLVVRHGTARTHARHGRSGGGRERAMTVALPGALDIAIRPEHYQRLAEKIAGKPEERIVSYLMLRSLKQARYAADPLGHFALAFDEYTHFYLKDFRFSLYLLINGRDCLFENKTAILQDTAAAFQEGDDCRLVMSFGNDRVQVGMDGYCPDYCQKGAFMRSGTFLKTSPQPDSLFSLQAGTSWLRRKTGSSLLQGQASLAADPASTSSQAGGSQPTGIIDGIKKGADIMGPLKGLFGR